MPRLPCLLESFSRYAVKGTFHELIIIAPDQEKRSFEKAFVERDSEELLRTFYPHEVQRELGWSVLPFPVRVLGDSELLSAPRARYEALTPRPELTAGGRGTGYRLQMVLKLAAARVVSTRFYVTLDCDVFLCRATDARELLLDGRAIIQGESERQTQHRKAWWQAADDILQAKGCLHGGSVGVPHIGVTPAILSVHASRSLQDEIERLYKASFSEPSLQRRITLLTAAIADASQVPDDAESDYDELQRAGFNAMRAAEAAEMAKELAQAAEGWGDAVQDTILFAFLSVGYDWSEYTLYWVAACKAGLIDRYHTHSNETLKLYGYTGFNLDRQVAIGSLHKTIGDDFFDSNRTVFGVIQSLVDINPLLVVEKLLPYLKPVKCASRDYSCHN